MSVHVIVCVCECVCECVLGSQDWCRNLLSDCVSARASSSPLVELLFLLRESLFLRADGILNVLPTKQYDWSKQNKATYTAFTLPLGAVPVASWSRFWSDIGSVYTAPWSKGANAIIEAETSCLKIKCCNMAILPSSLTYLRHHLLALFRAL